MYHRSAATALALIKWPLAIASAAFLPALAQGAWIEATGLLRSRYWWDFFAGAAGYALLWLLFIRKIKLSFLSTLEHELTHCLFAWATGNRVTGLTARLNTGGGMRIKGTPNWLIAVAPYFFPTVSVALLVASAIIDARWQPLLAGLIGVSVTYHIASTWQETHAGQNDLREAGLVFSLLFLPSANLLAYGLVFATIRAGVAGMAGLMRTVEQSPWQPFEWLSHRL
jgi:hypothetical protein